MIKDQETKNILEEEEEEEGALTADEVTALLGKVDLSLPETFDDDIMGSELLDHLSNFHKAKVGMKAARHSGDHPKAEQLGKLMSYSRLAAAIIQAQNPRAKALADELATVRAKLAKAQRQSVLGAKE